MAALAEVISPEEMAAFVAARRGPSGRGPRAAAAVAARWPAPEEPAAAAALSVWVPAGAQWREVVVDDRVVVGSSAHADVRLPHAAPRHCQLEPRPDGLCVRDLGGGDLRIAGAPLGQRGTLRPGQVLRVAGGPVVCLAKAPAGPKRPWVQAGRMGSATPAMWQTFADLALAGESGAPLLIGGESGAGKELAARFAHDASARADGPWVALNCAALPAGLLEAELFGARKGAFTGAVAHRDGAFVRADGGTLLLDELAELSPAAQAALLRVLETGEVQVVGGAVQRVDVRVIAATHRDLRQAVAAGAFRLDLLHRLAVTEVRLPALRERPRDLGPLLAHFLGAPVSAPCAQVLQRHPWPGNVRELRNVAARLAMRTGGRSPGPAELSRALGPRAAAPAPGSVRRERRTLVAELLATSATVSDAQRASGLPRSTFFRYVRRLRAEGAVAERSGGRAAPACFRAEQTLS